MTSFFLLCVYGEGALTVCIFFNNKKNQFPTMDSVLHMKLAFEICHPH